MLSIKTLVLSWCSVITTPLIISKMNANHVTGAMRRAIRALFLSCSSVFKFSMMAAQNIAQRKPITVPII